jgi:hypothetical protein
VRLHVSQLDAEPESTAHPALPWAIVLASGKRCVLAQGGTSADGAGHRLNYFCAARGPYLWGSVDRSRPTWRILASHSAGTVGTTPSGQRKVAIRAAWR